ncbi:hypothetical protein TNCV_2698993 [Trichonephila clavipes]|nr:hypothetical protein TNCV_2698993 [Trichonephila clavipes]
MEELGFLEGPSASKPYEKERLQVCDALRCPGPHVRYSRADNVLLCSLACRPSEVFGRARWSFLVGGPGVARKKTELGRLEELRAVDHSARGSMKNAASCEIWCELQNTQIADFSNAHCGSLPILGEPRLSEGRVKLAEDSRVQRVRVGPFGCHVRGLRGGRVRVPRDLPEGGRPGILPKTRNGKTVRPRIRRDHPPNLSISVSGGKENNSDSPSSGERKGKSPAPNPSVARRFQGNVA